MKGAHKLLASAVRNKLEALQGRYREKKQDQKETRQQIKQAREKIEEGIVCVVCVSFVCVYVCVCVVVVVETTNCVSTTNKSITQRKGELSARQLRQSVSRTKDKLSEAKRAEESATRQIATKEEQRTELRAKIDHSESRMTALEVDKTRLNALVAQHQKAEHEQTQRRAQLEAELRNSDNSLAQATLALHAAQTAVADKRSEIETKRSAVRRRRRRATLSPLSCSCCSNAVILSHSCAVGFLAAVVQLNDATSKLADCQIRVTSTTSSLESLEATKRTLNADIESLSLSAQHHETQLSALRSSIERAQGISAVHVEQPQQPLNDAPLMK
jgi:chromosome segregation ATPase